MRDRQPHQALTEDLVLFVEPASSRYSWLSDFPGGKARTLQGLRTLEVLADHTRSPFLGCGLRLAARIHEGQLVTEIEPDLFGFRA